ncbi:hypothetical protein NLX83_01120 [Allokutzneria sp. A3M-2-11 16]|uniref:hypothetical protein n=1 Tax=Allokutzneria sp. A3M-2-11 16 TaxID=2962043 RepID=UPI0020B8A265|nr:hypothetical protein [Allokutzneria sp. A3M-2-11 16]MCP3797851.1 hypothetical protein [Allokutzneria sp. A3M-2-11 16]
MSDLRSSDGQVMTRVEPAEWDTSPLTEAAPAPRPRGEAPVAEPPAQRPEQDRDSPADRLADLVADRSRKGWLIKGGVLAGVALLSGTLWSAADRTVTGLAELPSDPPQLVYEEHATHNTSDCAAHAYDDTQKFFQKTPCKSLVRTLFATKAKDGAPVVVSLAVVTMFSSHDATELEKLTQSNNTGNVNDLVREGRNVPGGPPSLKDAGYASAVDGVTVLIAESDFYNHTRKDVDLLREVSKDTLLVGSAMLGRPRR